MSRDFNFVPIIGPNSSMSDSNHQSLMSLNQSHNFIGDKFPGKYSGERFQQQNINKLRDQKLRCYLCEILKQEYSLIRTCGEFVCRGCFNYEGKDRVEQLIENARQSKFAHFTHNNNNISNSQILKSATIVESGDPPLLRLNKQPKLSPSNSNRSSNGLNNTTANIVSTNNKGLTKEPQQRCPSRKGKFEEQLNKIDDSLPGRKRTIWRQTETQQVSSKAPISSDTTTTAAEGSLSSIKQLKTVLPLNDDDDDDDDNFLNNQAETKQSSSSSSPSSAPLPCIQKRRLNQQSVVYKQQKDIGNSKLLSNTVAQNQTSLCQSTSSSSSDILNQIDYKIANEEQEMDDKLSLKQIEQIRQQNRFQFDSSNNLKYPLLFTQKNLTPGSSSQGNIQESYHPSLFRPRQTNMALQQPASNSTTVYNQAPTQDLMARMSVGGGGGNKRERSAFIGNQCNNLNGQNFPFTSPTYSIIPSNILYQTGANSQGLYGSPGLIDAYHSMLYRQHQVHRHPLSPPSQSSHGQQQHKLSSLLASPTFSFSNSSSNSHGNYTSLIDQPKGAQVILDPRQRNLSSSQEQMGSLNNQRTKTNSHELQLLDNNTLSIEQQSNINKSRHQNITKEQTTFEQQNVSPVTSPNKSSSIQDQAINGFLSSIDHTFMGSQSSSTQNLIQLKQSQFSPNSRSSLVKSLQMYHSNLLPTSSSDAKQQQPYLRDLKTIDVRDFDSKKAGKVANKTGAADKSSFTKHHNIGVDEVDKRKETPSRSTSYTKESAPILRQKLSDQRSNKASPGNNIVEQVDDTIVIDVEEEESDTDKTSSTTMSTTELSSSSRGTISDSNTNQFCSFKQPSSRSQQSLDFVNQVSTEDRLIPRQTTNNSTSIKANVDNTYPGSSKSNANFQPENNNNDNDNNNNNNEQASSCKHALGLKLNCLICLKNLVDRHFVQCPSVLSHKFCFSCTRNSIRDQREKYKLRVGEEEKIHCLSGEMCPLVGQKDPWTFMTSEVETIFREKDKRLNSHDQLKNVSSSSLSPPLLSNQQKFKRKSKLSNNDERIKKRLLMEPSNRELPSRPKGFDQPGKLD